MIEDRQSTLWMGTTKGGLNKFDHATGRFTHYRYDPNEPASFMDNDVRSLCEDRNGAIWVGTTKGLSKLVLITQSKASHLATSFVTCSSLS